MSNLAIFGGMPVIPEAPSLSVPIFDESEINNLRDVLSSREWGGIPFPNRYTSKVNHFFESELPVKGATMVSNGSDALIVALKALEIEAGDEVITTGYTWSASASAIVYCNAVPVFADIDLSNYCIDPKSIRKAITKKTKGLIVVHLANQVCDMDAIREIADEFHLFIVEDCAHAPFSSWKNQSVGTIGDIGTFSFESSKILTCGEGGMVITNKPQLHSKIRALVNCGRKEGTENDFYGTRLGWNYRASDIQAAVLLGQLKKLHGLTRTRKKNVALLFQILREQSNCLKPVECSDKRVTNRQLYCVLLEYNAKKLYDIPLDIFVKAVQCEGAELESRWYITLTRDPLFHITKQEWPMIEERYGNAIDADSSHLPNCDQVSYEKAIWVHYSLYSGTEEAVRKLADCILKVEKNAQELRDRIVKG